MTSRMRRFYDLYKYLQNRTTNESKGKNTGTIYASIYEYSENGYDAAMTG